MYNDVITGRQAVCILSVFLIGSAGITLGSRRAGAMSWLALLCGTAASLLLLWGLSWIIQKQQYRNLFELSRNCCGFVVGNTITVTLILYAILRGVCSVRAFCDMVSVTALPDTPVLFTALCVCAVAAILMKSGLHVTGKCSLVFIILIVLSVAATALLATANMDLTQLMVPAAPANVALDAIDYFTHPFCDAILVLCTFSRIKSGQNRWKLLLGGGALAAGVLLVSVIRDAAVLGSATFAALPYPSYYAVSVINVFDFIQRIEVLRTVTLLFGALVETGVCIYCACMGLSALCHRGFAKGLALPMGLLIAGLSALLFRNTAELTAFQTIFGWCAGSLTLLLTGILLLRLWVLQRKHRSKQIPVRR